MHCLTSTIKTPQMLYQLRKNTYRQSGTKSSASNRAPLGYRGAQSCAIGLPNWQLRKVLSRKLPLSSWASCHTDVIKQVSSCYTRYRNVWPVSHTFPVIKCESPLSRHITCNIAGISENAMASSEEDSHENCDVFQFQPINTGIRRFPKITV